MTTLERLQLEQAQELALHYQQQIIRMKKERGEYPLYKDLQHWFNRKLEFYGIISKGQNSVSAPYMVKTLYRWHKFGSYDAARAWLESKGCEFYRFYNDGYKEHCKRQFQEAAQ